jgi:hypothetical protein
VKRFILLGLAAWVGLLLWGPPACRLLDSRGIGCGWSLVEFQGRLLDAEGVPLTGRAICALYASDDVTDPELHVAFKGRAAAARAAHAGASADEVEQSEWMAVDPWALGLTDGHGRFSVRLRRYMSVSMVGDEVVSRSEAEPREVLHALLVETADGEPAIALRALPEGRLSTPVARKEDFPVSALVGLGDVRVPPESARGRTPRSASDWTEPPCNLESQGSGTFATEVAVSLRENAGPRWQECLAKVPDPCDSSGRCAWRVGAAGGRGRPRRAGLRSG